MADKDDDKTTDPAEDDDTGTDEGTDDAGTEDDEWKPPTKADWDAVQESLRKARRDARTARKARTSGSNGNGSTSDGAKDGDKPDLDKVRADAVAEADGKWKPKVVRSAARAAFASAGLVLPAKNADAALARVLKLLDVDDLEISDDGEVDGLSEQVEEIKTDFPELFTASGKSRAGRVDGADRGQTNGKAKTASELQAAALLGGSR